MAKEQKKTSIQKKIRQALKIIVFFSIGIILFWLAYRDQDISEIKAALKQANFAWIGLSLLLGIVSHISRALRWNILIQPLGYTPRQGNTFMAVMVMYLVNMAIPRVGEVTRCAVLSRYEKIPFSKLLGTVFTERAIDFLLLFLLLIVVIITQFATILDFFHANITDQVYDKLSSPYLWIGLSVLLVGAVVGAWIFRQKFRHTLMYQKISQLAKNFIEGIQTVIKSKRKWAIIGHSLFIYLMYFLMIYVCFFAFDRTPDLAADALAPSELGPLAGMAIFVMASLGMVAPAPGGVGAWHFMAYETMSIYGVPIDPLGAAFAFAVHGAMNLMLIVMGFAALVFLPIYNKAQNTANDKQELPPEDFPPELIEDELI